MEKFYAIKVGKDVNDIIVNSWEECKKYVLYYNSVYKSFKTKKEAQNYLINMSDTEIKNRLEKGEFYKKKELPKKIQTKYNFRVPYSIIRLINTSDKYTCEDFYCMIDIEVECKKISKKERKNFKERLPKNI